MGWLKQFNQLAESPSCPIGKKSPILTTLRLLQNSNRHTPLTGADELTSCPREAYSCLLLEINQAHATHRSRRAHLLPPGSLQLPPPHPMNQAPAAVRERFDSMFDRVTDELEQGIASAEERLHRMLKVHRIQERMLNDIGEMHAIVPPELVLRVQHFISLLMLITLKTFKQHENKYITDTGKCFHAVERCGNSKSSVRVQHAPLGLNPCKSCIQA